MDFNFQLPASVETEKVVLGAIFVGGDWGHVEHLDVDSFSIEKHRRIFAAMQDVAKRGSAVDRLTVAEELRATGKLESVDGLGYLSSLDDGLPHIENLPDYVRILEEKRALRSVLTSAQALIVKASSKGISSESALAELIRAVETVGTQIPGRGIPTIESIVDEIGASAVLGGEGIEAIASPWPELDKITGGFRMGELVIIGARPSQGKTVMATQIATAAAIQGKTAVVLSLEMSKESIIQRLIASTAGLPLYKLRSGLDRNERESARNALGRIVELKTLLLADSCATLARMRAALLKIASKQKIHVVAVDYLQLIGGSSTGSRRVEQITEISRGLKQLAVGLDCCMVVASQLSRESVKEEREPRLDDLRDSGSIEQDADLVIFPHRVPGQPAEERRVLTDFVVSKNRNGRLGRCPVVFEKPYVRFVERIA
jgi:replicative DNA helicase